MAKKKTNLTIPVIIISWILILSISVIGFSLYKSSIAKAAKAAKIAYEESLQEAHNSVYNNFKDKGFAAGEKRYHVSNRTTISIGDLKQTSNLQVLSVSDVEYNIEKNKMTSWAKMRGTGTFTVNLTLSEFVIDNDRNYVLVRCPEPQITSIKYDNDSYIELFHKDSLLGGQSDKKGVELTDTHKKAIFNKIKVALNSNESYFIQAEDSARTVLTNLIKAINIDIKDLTVEVEFFK